MKALLKVISLTLCLTILFIISQTSFAGEQQMGVQTRETRENIMAEQSILASLMVSHNKASQYICSQDKYACLGGDKGELGLALIGARSSGTSLGSLSGILRYQLDGSLAEDYMCYVLQKGKPIVRYLERLNAAKLSVQCHEEVQRMMDANPGLFGDEARNVCASPGSIEQEVSSLLEAINASRHCDPQDF